LDCVKFVESRDGGALRPICLFGCRFCHSVMFTCAPSDHMKTCAGQYLLCVEIGERLLGKGCELNKHLLKTILQTDDGFLSPLPSHIRCTYCGVFVEKNVLRSHLLFCVLGKELIVHECVSVEDVLPLSQLLSVVDSHQPRGCSVLLPLRSYLDLC
jgi:hypothetical protein